MFYGVTQHFCYSTSQVLETEQVLCIEMDSEVRESFNTTN
jgi:hypothetical protein